MSEKKENTINAEEMFNLTDLGIARRTKVEIEDQFGSMLANASDDVLNHSSLAAMLKECETSKVKMSVCQPPFGYHFSTTLLAVSKISKERNKAMVFVFNGTLNCVFPSFDCAKKYAPDFENAFAVYK